MKKHTTSKIVFFVFLIIALIVLIGGGIIAYYYNSNLDAIDTNDPTTIVFEVYEGDTVKSIASRLKDENLISDEFVFEMAAKFNDKTNIHYGTFYLNKTMDVYGLLDFLGNPKNSINDVVTVTIKEGSWAKDAAEMISKQCSLSSESLLALWNNEEYVRSLISKYWFITEDIFNDGQRVILEGFIYPETYEFFYDATAEEITEKILDALSNNITPLKSQMENFELSIFETFTLASIVEFESGNVEEMPTIAGVFMNRLHDGMLLQSSVTVCYTLYTYDDASECELGVNAEIDSPYNTYKHSGLPLGPILNPSYNAINSVLNYEDTPYYYFIGSNGVTYFAETYEEHQANIEEHLR